MGSPTPETPQDRSEKKEVPHILAPGVDARIFQLEAQTQFENALEDEAVTAFGPEYWYCGDLISHVLTQGKEEQKRPEALAAARTLFDSLKKWRDAKDKQKVTVSLIGELDLQIDPRAKTRLPTIEKSSLVRAANDAGEYRLPYKAAVALDVLFNSGHSATVTSPEQRAYKKLYFEPLNLADVATLNTILSSIL